jgi:predicted metal-dependent phosphoesterase TrpH
LIDLHTHTTASDGSFHPKDLVDEAGRVGLEALAITDHDTFAGYEEAKPYAHRSGLELIRGLELNSRLELPGHSLRYAHILAYFIDREPSAPFLDWLEEQRTDRRNRNAELIGGLQAKGIDITLEEAEAVGRTLTGRPHIARILVSKGYATDQEDAFRRYIGEDAPMYVERQSPTAAATIEAVRSGGGIPVVAHPVRLNLDAQVESAAISDLKRSGLLGLEVRHSDHNGELQKHYAELAASLGLTPTGGSDFHGQAKPNVSLGTGRNNNVSVPMSFLNGLRELASELSH